VEERVLVALRNKLMRRDLFEDFCHEYVRELNRLRMEHRASLSHGRQELAAVEREIRKFIQAIKDGVSALPIKDELLSLEARKAELQSRLEAPEMPELLHPRMSDVYREKVGSLCHALESEESRTGAADAIRALVEAIVLEPDGDRLKITLKGDLAGMLSAARDSKRSPDTGDLMVQIKLVAGARNHVLGAACEPLQSIGHVHPAGGLRPRRHPHRLAARPRRRDQCAHRRTWRQTPQRRGRDGDGR
jgi:site-specific DNA recombinase